MSRGNVSFKPLYVNSTFVITEINTAFSLKCALSLEPNLIQKDLFSLHLPVFLHQLLHLSTPSEYFYWFTYLFTFFVFFFGRFQDLPWAPPGTFFTSHFVSPTIWFLQDLSLAPNSSCSGWRSPLLAVSAFCTFLRSVSTQPLSLPTPPHHSVSMSSRATCLLEDYKCFSVL